MFSEMILARLYDLESKAKKLKRTKMTPKVGPTIDKDRSKCSASKRGIKN